MENEMVGSDWRDEQRAQYPRLFGGRSGRGRPRTGDGWRRVIESALRRISAAIESHEQAVVQITDIEEKYGTLRIEYAAVRVPATAIDAIENAIAIAEAISESTCETCGAPGRLYDHGGRFSACCADHARGTPLTGNEEDA
jgi:hypothetical protein